MFIFSSRNFSEMYRRIRYVQEYTRYQRAQGLAIAEREAVIAANVSNFPPNAGRKTISWLAAKNNSPSSRTNSANNSK